MRAKDILYRSSQLAVRSVLPAVKIPEPPVLAGPGLLRRFPEIIATCEVEKVLIITGHASYKSSHFDDFTLALKAQGIDYALFNGTDSNPTLENVTDALAAYFHHGCQGIVAYGGGSIIDCAKITAAKVKNDRPIERMRGMFKLKHKLPPFFAIPTTAGSGSEASIAAVITNTETQDKFAICDPKLVPTAVLLDGALTLSLPPDLTAQTGMDALTHAVEAFIGNYDTPYVKEKAILALKSILDNLEALYDDGTDLEARQKMLVASMDAGMAFTRAYVGYCHAIAHSLGGRYGISHGLANAVVLPHVLDYSKDAASAKLAELAFYTGLGDASLSDEELTQLFIQKIREMNAHMGIPTTLPQLMVEDIPELARHALKEANPTYPVPKIMHYNDCVEIFGKLLSDTEE